MGLLSTSSFNPLLPGIIPPFLFNKRATTQRRSVSYDSGGGPITTYADYLLSVPCRFNPNSGTESGSQGRLNSETEVRIYVQFAPDIVATDRIILDGRVFDIRVVRRIDEITVFLTLDCYEVIPSGEGE